MDDGGSSCLLSSIKGEKRGGVLKASVMRHLREKSRNNEGE